MHSPPIAPRPATGPGPLDVATDGSGLDVRGGYAVVTAHRYFYGPVHPGPGDPERPNVELAAIEQALILIPGDQALRLHTDCSEAIDRIGHQRTPRRPSRSEQQIRRIQDLIAAREGSIEFVRVHQATAQQPLHAAAHLLAFLGRDRLALPEPGVAALVAQIFASPQPDDLAHDLVRRLLYPLPVHRRTR